MIVYSGGITSLAKRKIFLSILSHNREIPEVILNSKRLFQRDLLRLGDERAWVFYLLLDGYLRPCCLHITSRRHMEMLFPAPAYISGISRSTIDSTADAEAVTIESRSLRRLQRVLGAERFYRIRRTLDNVLVVKVAIESSMWIGVLDTVAGLPN